MSDRLTQLNRWLEQLGYDNYRLSPASADASFRCYWRLHSNAQSLIVMDAPPQQESCDSFIAVAAKLRAAGLNAPEILAQELELGFLLLTDFGDQDYLGELDANTEAALYGDALAALLAMQVRVDAGDLPRYDAALLEQEMELFHDWFLDRLLGIALDAGQMASWRELKKQLIDNALAQPQVFVHRDYHSRNLMRLAQKNPGILDFQDALQGPMTYDLVSLLRDCYIAWPRPRVEQLALEYYESARSCGLVEVDSAQFLRWFNRMGVQRHLKAIGIFSRLKIRDGKSGYIKDIPRTLKYIQQIGSGDVSLAGLELLLDSLRIAARVESVLER